MSFVIGVAVCAAFIAIGMATNWFGLPAPESLIIAGVGGFLSTAVIGPALDRAANGPR